MLPGIYIFAINLWESRIGVPALECELFKLNARKLGRRTS